MIGATTTLLATKLRFMDQYGNPGPYQDPKMREWWDALEVEQENSSNE